MDANAIFDAFIDASNEIHKKDEIRKKKAQIDNVRSLRCGNCNHWMKSTCKREKEYGEFKSMSTPACGSFSLSRASIGLVSKFQSELMELEQNQ